MLKYIKIYDAIGKTIRNVADVYDDRDDDKQRLCLIYSDETFSMLHYDEHNDYVEDSGLYISHNSRQYIDRIHDLGIIDDKEYKDYIAGIDNSNIEKDRNEYERLKKIFEPPKTKE